MDIRSRLRRALMADFARASDPSGAWLLDERMIALLLLLAAAFACLVG